MQSKCVKISRIETKTHLIQFNNSAISFNHLSSVYYRPDANYHLHRQLLIVYVYLKQILCNSMHLVTEIKQISENKNQTAFLQ